MRAAATSSAVTAGVSGAGRLRWPFWCHALPAWRPLADHDALIAQAGSGSFRLRYIEAHDAPPRSRNDAFRFGHSFLDGKAFCNQVAADELRDQFARKRRIALVMPGLSRVIAGVTPFRVSALDPKVALCRE